MNKFKKMLFINITSAALDEAYWQKLNMLAEKKTILPKDDPSIIKELQDTDCLLVGFATPITQKHIDAAPHLKYIGTLAIAHHAIDGAYARKKQIPVTNIAGYCTDSVAEFIFSVILNHIRQLDEGRKRSLEHYYDFAGMTASEIRGKTFGVIGLGNIGKRTAEIAQGFGAHVIYWSKHRKKDYETKGIKFEEKNTLLKIADFISLNFALTPETENFLNDATFSQIKSGAVIISTIPMETINLPALEKRLRKGDITFILDHSDEMKKEDLERLHKYDNCVIYPPIAFISKEARANKQQLFISNIENFLNGKTTNVVN